MIKTIRFRIKDKNISKHLDLMARDVNFVWNVINSAARKKWKESRKHFHKFDPYFTDIIKGAPELLSINSKTMHAILAQFDKDIRQSGSYPRFRGKKSAKWIPFIGRDIKVSDGCFVLKRKKYKFWQSKKINGLIKSGCFTCDPTGKWFVSFNYDCQEENKNCGTGEIGLDLGLKTTATCSNGEFLSVNDLEVFNRKIAKLQRARRFKLVKNIHKKKNNIKNDRFNKFALGLVKTNGFIAIGDVSGFTKGVMAKSRYENSWSKLKCKIEFKAMEYGVPIVEVPEHFTTQTCNVCGSVEGPKGIKELSVRLWKCSCGAELNRDINAAINILNRAKCLAS